MQNSQNIEKIFLKKKRLIIKKKFAKKKKKINSLFPYINSSVLVILKKINLSMFQLFLPVMHNKRIAKWGRVYSIEGE